MVNEDNEDYNSYVGKQIKSYTILRRLASGGFAHVYLARNNFNDHVAIKLLDAKHQKSQAQQLFLQEAQFLQELEHNRYILPILDYGESEGTPYIVVEYAPGGTLRERINNAPPVAIDDALTILLQIGEALWAAHQQNIVHGDLKPENILFNKKNEALLADFGIANRLGKRQQCYDFPRGTYAYMAPEQFDGIFTKESDQYAFGCIAYELITGSHPLGHMNPFHPHDHQTMRNGHKNMQPLPVRERTPDIPNHIEYAILKALAKSPLERHTTVNALIQALQRATSPPLASSRPTSPQQNTDSLTKLQMPITNSPEIIFLSPHFVEAYCEVASSEEQFSKVSHHPLHDDPSSLPVPKNVDNKKPKGINRAVQNIHVTEDHIFESNQDGARPKFGPLEDLRLPLEFQNLLSPILTRLRLKFAENQARDQYTRVRRLYTVVQTLSGGQQAAHYILYIPKQYLNKTNPKKLDTVRSVGSAFAMGRLIIFTDASGFPDEKIWNILSKQWPDERKLQITFVPYNHLQAQLKEDLEEQELWLTEKLELSELLQSAESSLSVQQIDGNDTEALIEIISRLRQLTDEGGRGWRMLLHGAKLDMLVNRYDFKGAPRYVAWQLIDQLKTHGRLPKKPECDVLGQLLRYILTFPEISSDEKEDIKRIIRNYNMCSCLLSGDNNSRCSCLSSRSYS